MLDPKKVLTKKSLTQKKSLQNFKPKKCPQIAIFKPKKGLRTTPSLIYLSTPLGPRYYLDKYTSSIRTFSTRDTTFPILIYYHDGTLSALSVPPGGYSISYWVGMCRWDSETLSYTRPRSNALCKPILG